MKKFYMLLSAACVVASASAVVKPQVAKSNLVVTQEKAQVAKAMTDKFDGHAKVPATSLKKSVTKSPADGDYVYFRPASNLGAIGFSPAGSGYTGLGFASSYGDLVFNNYSQNVKTNTWNYVEFDDYEIANGTLVWGDVKTSNEENFAAKSGLGYFKAPELSVLFNSGDIDTYTLTNSRYLCGASADYFGLNKDTDPDEEQVGITFYQHPSLKNPEGYNGAAVRTYMYNTQSQYQTIFNANGVCKDWEDNLKEDFGANSVTDIKMSRFLMFQPKPVSTYMMTRAWAWMNVTATAATMLTSYIYPVDEEGVVSDEPIAVGYATIAQGENDSPIFYYNPLNEDGDEIEGDVYVDTEIAISIEGFADNDAIVDVTPTSGFYPFDINAFKNSDRVLGNLVNAPTMYLDLNFKADGVEKSALVFDSAKYYYDQTKNPDGSMVDSNTISLRCYAFLMTDAVFGYIHSVDGVDSVTIPQEGGSVDVKVDALYYNIKALLGEEYDLYALDAPEWVKVEVSDPDAETYETTLTISAEAASEARSGVVSLSGMGVSLDITVNQGAGAGDSVEVVKAENGAQYYDLAGRRVVNPEKGVYVKVNGNKTEKVIL